MPRRGCEKRQKLTMKAGKPRSVGQDHSSHRSPTTSINPSPSSAYSALLFLCPQSSGSNPTNPIKPKTSLIHTQYGQQGIESSIQPKIFISFMMAPLQYLGFRKVFLFCFFLLLFSLFISAVHVSASEKTEALDPPKKKTTITSLSSPGSEKNQTKTKLIKLSTNSSSSSKNQTKLIKPSSAYSSKIQTKLLKTITSSSKNKTKSIKSSDDLSDMSKTEAASLNKIKLKKLNSTKAANSTKSSSVLVKKSSDLLKTSSGSKNKTTKSVGKSEKKVLLQEEMKSKDSRSSSSSSSGKTQDADETKTAAKKKQQQQQQSQKQKQKQKQPNWIYDDEDDDLVSGFKDLPTKFQQTFVPDLHRISTNSKIYLSNANKEFAKGFKPYVGSKYAPTIATAISCAFIIIPLLLVSLIINRIKAYFSLQKIVIFIQIYLSIYFSILCLSSLVTGLEPLRLFYATSQSTYIWLQVLQTLGYVMYLLLLLMYLVLVFSTDSGLGSKFLGLAQTFVGFAVGLHYYMTVFHRVVLHQPPKTSWEIHGIYAACFLVICLSANAERRKKAYLEDGGEEGKKN
ncbi:hypothetical protein Ancab_003393 [Ancistrocladus abbreviatus]